ncbi:hypothetical protein D8Y22_12740 [Salinadaptatus halalkaliphilus]|uniref:DUF7845 domain-containing protein n=1 Tax=Salinadaptatus halalkaliphilus TaxID=2419781 RepID=A0A4S3TK72_9EURY|nr:hypothetical protein [Salinadaptatus halalkaliphilus]THE64504.1 hypothetical protein D8Y22_12740 [Salinadaptatus halalkaliphilus]
MSREPDRDDLENATDDAFDVLEGAETLSGADDEIETSIEQTEVRTTGADEIDGVELEFDEDKDDADESGPRAVCRFCQTEFNNRVSERRHHSEDRCKEGSPAFRPDGRPLIDPQLHKFGAHFLFVPGLGDLRGGQDGLAPFFGIVSQFDERCLQGENGEDGVGTFESAGDTWELNHDEDKVKYWQGQIETRPGDSGDAYYEYQIGVVADDAVGRKRINFQFRPSLPEAMNAKSGDRIQSMPADLPEGIRVQVESANVEPDEIFDVLQDLMVEIDVDPEYFKIENLHEHSRVTGLELYVRAVREIVEQQVIETNALLDRLSQFSSIRRGRGKYEWDNEEIIGHRHAVAMNDTSLEKLYGDHEIGKLLKSYLMKNPEKQGGPTAEPKIEVQWNKEYSDYLGGNAVPWNDPDGYDFDDLRDELDTHLMFALNAAELPLRADPSVYVADEYWNVTESDRDITVHTDPTEQLKEAEEDLTRAQFARDDLTATDRAFIQALADGGPQHYEQLVEKTETSSSSVYRSIDKWGSLVEKVGRGTYDMADDVVREKIEDVFAALEDVTEWVEDGIDAIVDGSEEIADDSPLAKWARRHGAVFAERYDELEVELNGSYSKYELQKLLRSGLKAAEKTGAKTRARFVDGTFSYRLGGDRRENQEPFHYVGDRLFCLGNAAE